MQSKERQLSLFTLETLLSTDFGKRFISTSSADGALLPCQSVLGL